MQLMTARNGTFFTSMPMYTCYSRILEPNHDLSLHSEMPHVSDYNTE